MSSKSPEPADRWSPRVHPAPPPDWSVTRPEPGSDLGDQPIRAKRRRPAPPSRGGWGRRLWLALGLALLTGLLVGIAQPMLFLCAARFRVAGEPSSDPTVNLRRELLDYVATHLTQSGEPANTLPTWSVDTPTAGELRLLMTAPRPQRAVGRLRELANGFAAHVAAQLDRVRQTPTPAEHLLQAQRDELHARLADAEQQLESALHAMPTADPRDTRAQQLDRWHRLRGDLRDARQELIDVSGDLSRLEAEPPPDRGLVTSEEREQARLACEPLQQDLAELEVQLTLVQRELLAARDALTEARQNHADATLQLAALAEADYTWLAGTPTAKLVERYVIAAERYAQLQRQLSRAWDAEFEQIAGAEITPIAPRLIDAQQRVRQLVADFLFDGGQELSTLRETTEALAQGPGDDARFHVLHSDLVRRFQVVQRAHHRFEFAAGQLEVSGNFRLDTALRSARGLHRRVRARLRQIDDELETAAVARARQERLDELAQTRTELLRRREAVDHSIDAIIGLQTELNLQTDLTEEFLHDLIDVELANTRVDLMQRDLDQTQQHLRRLADQRREASEARVEVVSCAVIDGPLHLGTRLGWAGGAAMLALLGALGVQAWWWPRAER